MSGEELRILMYSIAMMLIVIAVILSILKTSKETAKIQKIIRDAEQQIANQNQINYNFNVEIIKILKEIQYEMKRKNDTTSSQDS